MWTSLLFNKSREPRWSSGYRSRLSSGRPGFCFPELAPTYHPSVHCIYPLYSSSSVGWGRKMAIPYIGALLRARKRTGVTVLVFHVSLYPISDSLFFPLCTRESQWPSGYTSRLSSRRPGFESRSWLPHIIHFFIVYIHRIHRSLVSELYSGHVKEPGWLWWNTMSLCIWVLSLIYFLYARYMCEYNELNSLYSDERLKNSISSSSSMHDRCVIIMPWITYIVLKDRKTPIPPPHSIKVFNKNKDLTSILDPFLYVFILFLICHKVCRC